MGKLVVLPKFQLGVVGFWATWISVELENNFHVRLKSWDLLNGYPLNDESAAESTAGGHRGTLGSENFAVGVGKTVTPICLVAVHPRLSVTAKNRV
jgi:hypothetical protein